MAEKKLLDSEMVLWQQQWKLVSTDSDLVQTTVNNVYNDR